MSVEIRPSTPVDANAIREVHLAAFPTPLEADLVDRLTREGDSVNSLVAEDKAAIVGHVLLSRMRVEGDGRTFRALGLAPVAVLPARQGSGIGGALIRQALEQARRAGEELIFLVGEPDYYCRFGFSAETAARFSSPYSGPYWMALALNDRPLPSSGKAEYAAAFAELDEVR